MSVNKKIIEAEATQPAPPPPADSFNVILYTGDRPTNAPKTGVGFQPDLVFIKGRTQNDFWSVLDSTRGANVLSCDTTGAESSFSGWSFDSDGFTIPSSGQANNNGTSYVAFCWRANGGTTSSNTDGSITSTVQVNQNSGFSIVKYTGSGSAGMTVGHGLSSAPEIVIIKNLTTGGSAYAWQVFGGSLFERMNLNNTVIDQNNFGCSFSSTTFQTTQTSPQQGNPAWNGSNQDYIAYCFHSVAGYSKIGSYTGTGTTNSITGLGFQPDWIMIKRTDSANSWTIFDSVRDGYTDNDKILWTDLSDAEATGGGPTNIDFTSNGFAFDSGVTGGSINANGGTYIYMAFKISS